MTRPQAHSNIPKSSARRSITRRLKADARRPSPSVADTLIRQGIEAGRFHGKEDAVLEAMSLWEERERRRLEIVAAVEQAEASLARGEGRRITTHEGVTQLTEDIRRRGMARLSAEQNLRR
jgi:Arc/MetJ-type ribon-helix-helix transcriptional regulator